VTRAHIKQPALVLLGRHDTIVPIINAEVFAGIPQRAYRDFADSAHASFVEESDHFNETVGSFVLS
jgi:pimeloyl-ACP methyl ester carboxylesterase